MAPESSRDQCNKEGCSGCRHCNGADTSWGNTSLSGFSDKALKKELKKREADDRFRKSRQGKLQAEVYSLESKLARLKVRLKDWKE